MNTIINKNKQKFYLFITFYPALFLLGLTIENVCSTNLLLPSVIFLLFYFNIVVSSIKNNGGLSLYSFYLYTSFFFIYSKIFFAVIGYTSFLVDDWPVYYQYEKDSGLILLIISFTSQFVLHVYITVKHQTKKLSMDKIIHNEKLQNVALFFFCLSFPFILVKEIVAFKYLKNFGYLFLYSGKFSVDYPVWTKGSGTIFYLSFLFLLVSRPSKMIFKITSALFIGYLFIDALKGGRASFVCGAASILYFYNKFYPGKIKIHQLILVFALLMSVALFIGQTRDTRNAKNIQIDAKTVVNFFNSQNVSIAVPLSIIEWKEKIKEYRRYPFIFTELFTPIYNLKYPELSTPSIERIKSKNEMEGIVSYIYSPKMYLKGWGLGVAFLAEAYDFCGLIGIIFWSFVLGFLIQTTERKMTQKNTYILIAWFVVNSILFLPRGHFFAFVTSAYKYCIFAVVLCSIIDLFFYPKKIHLNKKQRKG